MDVHEAFELRDTLEIGSNELVVEISQLLAKGAFGNASVLSASINIEQHGHVKVRSLSVVMACVVSVWVRLQTQAQ